MSFSNSKAQREQLLKQAGRMCPTCNSPAPHLHPAMQFEGEVQPCKDAFHLRITAQNVAFTCKSCWRRSLQSDLARLQCPFCGGNMREVQP